ncbi:MAG TPA: ABC transporter permease subunit [Rhizobiaceae bacterium]|nr:ABC transporter permease subunit [Rhizobiaceae bacterium]
MQMCIDPKALEGLAWFFCYLTNPKHQQFYFSFITVLLLVGITAPIVLVLGFAGALARRSTFWPLSLIGHAYTSMVRGIPDIVFFLFVPVALDQLVEFTRHKVLCPEVTEPVYRGNDFVVCDIAKMPLNSSPQWLHESCGFALAIIAFAIVFGAFAANTIDGALRAVPRPQLETARAFGMSNSQTFFRIHLPQMWIYALPGLSNLWVILIKATPLLFLLGISDIVYWARELGGMKTEIFDYPHPDWRLWYFLALLIFYLFMTWISEKAFAALTRRVSRGQATAAGGEALEGAR